MSHTITQYLDSLARRPRTHPRAAPRDGLHALLARMGHPERRVRCVHIAGSKGKGSTALMLDAMLRTGGRHTGVFTSPHIERWNERIRLAGEPVSDAQLGSILAELRPHVSALHEQSLRGPDFFEVLLVAALCLFEQAGVDEAIIEAGIGARFDATLVVDAMAAALVSVELEHTAVLGSDLAAIASDKAAVARPGMPLVMGTLAPAAYDVVIRHAKTIGATLIEPCPHTLETAHVVIDDEVELPLPAPSRAQAACAAVAWGCVQALQVFAQPAPIARRGMQSLVLPGRLEVLARQPLVVADSAHTSASIAALVETLQAWGLAQAPLFLVLSCSSSRDLASLAAPLVPYAQQIYVTRADDSRSAEPTELAQSLYASCAAEMIKVIESPKAALAEARNQAPAHGFVCATGSVYMAGAARRFIGRGCNDLSQ